MKTVLAVCNLQSDEIMNLILLADPDNKSIFTSDLKRALHILTEFPVDLVITDYKPPTLIGLKLLDAMKKDSKLKTIPVIGIADSLYWKDRLVFNGARKCCSVLDNPSVLFGYIKSLLVDKGGME